MLIDLVCLPPQVENTTNARLVAPSSSSPRPNQKRPTPPAQGVLSTSKLVLYCVVAYLVSWSDENIVYMMKQGYLISDQK